MKGVRTSLLFCAVLLAGARSLAAPHVGDDPNRSAAARALAIEGRDAFNAGDYARAIDCFERAHALVPAPTLVVYEARALARLGRLVEASNAYARVAHSSLEEDSPAQFRRAVREAEVEHAQLLPRVPRFIVVVNAAAADRDLTLTADGQPLSRDAIGRETLADPGKHRGSARSSSGTEALREFSLKEGETKRVELSFDSPRAAPAVGRPVADPRDAGPTGSRHVELQRTMGFIALGVGALGVGTGVVTGLLAASERDDAAARCPNRICTEGSEGESALDSFRALRTVSTTGYVVGAVGIATGVTFLVLSSGKPARTTQAVRLWLGAGAAGVRGAF